MNIAGESELPSQAVTIVVCSSKKYAVLWYPDGRLCFLLSNSRHFLWSAAFSWSYWEQYLLELIIWFSRRHRRKVKVFIAQSYLTLRDPTGCTLPSSFVQGIFQARILEWEGNTEGNCHSLLQGIFPTQGSNPGLLHCRQILYQLSYQGSPKVWLIIKSWEGNLGYILSFTPVLFPSQPSTTFRISAS